jgi:hypothetical protein
VRPDNGKGVMKKRTINFRTSDEDRISRRSIDQRRRAGPEKGRCEKNWKGAHIANDDARSMERVGPRARGCAGSTIGQQGTLNQVLFRLAGKRNLHESACLARLIA